MTIVAAWMRARDGRRARHRVRQPDVERDLRALADRAEEEEEADDVDGDVRPGRERRALREVDEREVGRPEEGEDPEDAEHHPDVADAVRDERLLAGGDREVLVVVVADQEVRAEADALPAHEEEREVVREDEREHREHEEVQEREVASVALLVLHVADAVDVDERSDERDEREHERRQRVEAERDVDGVVARGHPRVDVLDDGGDPLVTLQGLEDVRDERGEGEDGREADRPDADDAVEESLRVGKAPPSAGRRRAPASAAGAREDQRDEPVHEEAREGEDRDEPELVHARPTTSAARSCPRPPCGGRGRARRRSRGRRKPRRPRRRSRRRRSSVPPCRRACART